MIVSMNKLSIEKRAQIISCFAEGNSLRSTSRMVDVSLVTVLKFLKDIGEVCSDYQDRALRNLPCKRIQVDEIWSFVGAKDKNLPLEELGKFGRGSVWTWVAIDADTKLVPSWLISDRSAEAATVLMRDLAGRLANRVQLTTDGHKAYLNIAS